MAARCRTWPGNSAWNNRKLSRRFSSSYRRLSGGLKRNTQTQDGLQSLLNALQGGHHQRYIEEPGRALQPEAIQDGNNILGHLLGSKDVSRQVAQRASDQTGIGSGILKQMLPVVASMVMGSLSKQTQDPSMQATMAGLSQGRGGSGAPNLGGFAQLLDADGDGNVMDDVMNLASKFLSR